MNKNISLTILFISFTSNLIICENDNQEKKSNNKTKYIIGAASTALIIVSGYIGYKYYKKHDNRLPINLEKQEPPAYLYESLNIQYGDGTSKPNICVESLDKKLNLLSKASAEAREALDIIKEIAEENNLPEDHNILKVANDIFLKKPQNNPEDQISLKDLESLHEDDQNSILLCIRLLERCMKNAESAFDYMRIDNKKRTPNKIHKKTKRPKINSGVFKPDKGQ